jgi:SAM-dependent methyltransferase
MRSLCIRGLDATQKVIGALRRRLAARDSVAAPSVVLATDRPNSAEEWESVYLTPVKPVTTLTNVVARTIVDLTRSGDVVLETGCGSGELSAEVAIGGRTVELCDFSREILDRAARVFEASNLPKPGMTQCDITKELPWADRTVDCVWNSGVLEHWSDEELLSIVREFARISRRLVVSFVPYAGCLGYRWGKHVMETQGRWPYGRETPRQTLRHVFEGAGITDVSEFTMWPEIGLGYFDQIQPGLSVLATKWWRELPANDPLLAQQGYLLCTVGTVMPASGGVPKLS